MPKIYNPHLMMNFLGISVILLLLSSVLAEGDSTINTSSGVVEGINLETATGRRVKAFLGIPYAIPPIGELRFKPPVPIEPLPITFKAHNYSKSCIQGNSPKYRNPNIIEWWIPAEDDESEDCLTLNIWVPNPVPKKAAVMVWIHGGGFEGGTSSYKFDGQVLATEGDVIVVTINYRLGVFGFLYLDNEEVSGTMGIKDQALALKWVQNNIEKFGGDPEKVTIFGESAGGVSANHLLSVIPSSKGLFKRAIIQSGTGNSDLALKLSVGARAFAKAISKTAGCSEDKNSSQDILNCFKSMDAKKLINTTFFTNNTSVIKWAPVIDGHYITLDVETAFKENIVDSKVDVMVGVTTDEGSMFVIASKLLEIKEDSFIDQKTFFNIIKQFLQIDNDLVVRLVHHFYTNWEDPDDKYKIRQELINFLSDIFIVCKTNEMSDLLASNGNKVYRYQFSHYPSDSQFPSWTGAAHTDEISFVFGLPLNPKYNFTEDEIQLSRSVIYFWTNFAKFGNPNGACAKDEAWPLYSVKTKDHINLGLQPKRGKVEDLRYKTCALYDNLLPKFRAALPKQL